LLLLDEPFGALDALTRIKMHGLLADLCRRHRPAVVLVTHDVDEALLLADRALVLRADVDGGSENGGTDQAVQDGGARIVHDIPIDLGGHRLRADPRFVELRHQLLHELGVDDDDELIADPAVAS
jgi:sulfonate transport system ATP-binding protein